MGALTSKPTAFNFRTWELNSMLYVDCQDSLVPKIRVDMYQKKIVRVLPLDDWISDNIRFLFLGLDKQTLKAPALIFKLKSYKILEKLKLNLRQHTLKVIMHYLVKKITGKNKLQLNLLIGSIFTNIQIFNRLNHKNLNLNFSYKNSYLQNYNENLILNNKEIYLINLNPRLDSPLFNLKLKELEDTMIYSIGNYQSMFSIISNNIKTMMNLGKKSLLVVSENYKSLEYLYNYKVINLSPVYLNQAITIEKNRILQKNNTINFNLGINNDLAQKGDFEVRFNTKISKLNFDIYIPITNYFVSKGEMSSTKGLQKLKMIRPSFNLFDIMGALTLMLNKSNTTNNFKPKIYNYIIPPKTHFIFNRLSYK